MKTFNFLIDNIDARDIKALDINAFELDIRKPKQSVTLELTDEQLDKIKKVLEESK